MRDIVFIINHFLGLPSITDPFELFEKEFVKKEFVLESSSERQCLDLGPWPYVKMGTVCRLCSVYLSDSFIAIVLFNQYWMDSQSLLTLHTTFHMLVI